MIKKILSSLALTAICLATTAQTLNPMQAVENDPAVRIGTLESGAKYYIRANKKDPQRANFHIVYGVGAVQEEDHQNGLAHFLEHMAFNGSTNFADNKLIDYLQSIGVKFGENLNAGTGQELTTYMVTNVPLIRESIVDSLLLVLHDWAGFISLNDKDIDEERGVIREEWRQGNNANRRVMEKQFDILFNNSIYAKRNIIGNEDVLKTFTYQALKDFYKKWYRPDLQAFVIVGDFDVDKMEAKLKATMADIKPYTEKTPRNVVVIPENEKPIIGIVADPELTSTGVEFAIRHQPLGEKYNNTVLRYKMNILSGLISSMLNERLQEIKLAPNAPFLDAGAGYYNFVKPADLFDFNANAKEGGALKALEGLYTEVQRMKRGGFTEAELSRAKSNMLSRYDNSYKNRNDVKNAQYVNQYMSNFLKNSPIPDAEKEYEIQKILVDQTSLDEINQTAKALITDKNNMVLISMPKKEGVEIPTEAEVSAVLEKVNNSEIEIKKDEAAIRPLISKALNGSAVAKVAPGDFGSTVWTLHNGIKVILKKTDFKADEIILSATQKGGKSKIADIPTLYSSDFYTVYLPMSGVSDFSQTELNKMLAGKNARVNLAIGDFSQSIQGVCAPKDLETMMQLIYLRYTAPRFDSTSYSAFKNQFQTMFANFSKNPDYIVQDSLSQTVYGHNPRESAKLSPEIFNIITLNGLSEVHKELFSSANGMVFTIVGNYDEAVLKPLVEQYIGSLPVGKKVETIGKYNVSPVKGKVDNIYKVKMETPKVTSITVYTGKSTGTSAEAVAIKAINYVLDIRYTKSVREEAGGTYGVQSMFTNKQNPHPNYQLLIMYNTDMSKIAKLQPIIYKEINDLVANGPTVEDLNKAKENFVKKFAEVNNTNGAWVGYILNKAVWSEDNYTNYLKDVEALTPSSIQKVSKELFTQGNICTVIQEPQE